jgi:ankyrin repeat protein
MKTTAAPEDGNLGFVLGKALFGTTADLFAGFIVSVSQDPLHKAAELGREQPVVELLKSGAKVDAPDSDGRTPLHKAAEGGHDKVVTLLLASGANGKTSMDKLGRTAMHMAAGSGHTKVVRTLMEGGFNARENRIDRTGANALHYAARGNHSEVVKMLLDADAHPNIPDDNGNTALRMAAAAQHAGAVRVLLEGGADCEGGTYCSGVTPLHRAAAQDATDIVKLLLDAGANVNAVSDLNQQPIHFAVDTTLAGGAPNATRMLLQAGSDVDGSPKSIRPLYYAVWHGHEQTVQALLEARADPTGAERGLGGMAERFRFLGRAAEIPLVPLLESRIRAALEAAQARKAKAAPEQESE